MRRSTTLRVGIMAIVAAITLSGCTATPADTTDTVIVPNVTGGSSLEFAASSGDCETMAATFRDVESANAGSPEPELVADCAGDALVVTSNSIPDYFYVPTTEQDLVASPLEVSIELEPQEADTPSDLPLIGAIAVAVDGSAIYGPTDGSGGDQLAVPSAISDCGGHSSAVEFHLHIFGWAEGVDCLYSAEEVESGDSLVVGWSPDGYPIMSGLVCADDTCSSMVQLTSSWQLTDVSRFATDTWTAHSYVEGSGDLDECNGRVDSDGQYRYYTTATFPYFMGCYHGEVSTDAIVTSVVRAPGDNGGGQ